MKQNKVCDFFWDRPYKLFSGDFECSWGPIPISKKCDGTNNCGDNSDEENCITITRKLSAARIHSRFGSTRDPRVY